MRTELKPIAEWYDVDRHTFEHDILPTEEPAILRGLVSDWPLVEKSQQGDEAVVDYIKSYAGDRGAYTIVGQPDIHGAFSYSDDFSGVNFKSVHAELGPTLDQILQMRSQASPHAIAIQAAEVDEVLPGMRAGHQMSLLPASVAPTMWISNQALVAPHYDADLNIAAVVAGRRRFTLFPPNQVANLYVGPMLNSPGGVPISLVNLRSPDLTRYPRFATALENAQQAELEPGDAIYMPPAWWHAVESLEPLNVLINYWWGGRAEQGFSPNASLMHSMISIARLPAEQRHAWRELFDYFVFHNTGDPNDHLPSELRDVTTEMSPEQRESVLNYLKDNLK